ncbi:Uncharacterized protein APZ42_021351 [Daphnia magna]|uniref:Uncharacterized protein n=1 Tax=Daphnia magna TaxID=35525 RepID=A0A164WRG0_9CRUS|nr:Uncharacterized protein APZ42_021351 [Daphnia magna]
MTSISTTNIFRQLYFILGLISKYLAVVLRHAYVHGVHNPIVNDWTICRWV